MQRMAHHVTITQDVLDADILAIDGDVPALNGVAVVVDGAIAELVAEDREDGTTAPALFAVGVVGVVVGFDAAEVVAEVVGARPRVADGGCEGVGGRWEGGA